MKRFLLWLSARLRCRIIADDGAVYLERYYLFSAFGMRCYLHRFVASDPDRGQHDHPWPWAFSLILAGWYIEETRSGPHLRKWINFLTGDTFHRVVIPAGSEVWTLFAHRAKRAKPWGFLRPQSDGSMLWQEYTYPGQQLNEERRWWLFAPLGCNEPRRKV